MVVKWTYELGKSLVPPEVVSVLPTLMYKLHQHYMRAMTDCIFMQGAKIKDDDFLWGEAIIWINWEEIYQLFHQEALDISMVGVFYSPYILFCMISTYLSLDLFGIM